MWWWWYVDKTTASTKNPIILASSSASAQNSSRTMLSTRKTNISTKKTSNRNDDIEWLDVMIEITLRLGIAVTSGYILMWLTRQLFPQLTSEDNTSTTTTTTTVVVKRLFKILQNHQKHKPVSEIKNMLSSLSSYEIQMAEDIIDPIDVDVNFSDIGGMDHIKREIYELVVMPLIRPDFFTQRQNSKLIQPCKGILLYGKPGTGKTMLAKALAKESRSVFLPLQLSKILNKYWGESNKLIAATFQLAYKLQPSIIFIDELDTFLKNTGSGGSNDATAFMDSIKAEFLTLWDGLNNTTTNAHDRQNNPAGTMMNRVMVLGATNKPHHIDAAILRRMPRAFEIPLPDASGRLQILQLLLQQSSHHDNDDNEKNESLEPPPHHNASCVEPDVMKEHIHTIVEMSKGYSGSDLKELCQAAAMVAVRERTAEYARRRVMGEAVDDDDENKHEEEQQPIRPISYQDFLIAFDKVKRTGEFAFQYGQRINREEKVNQQRMAQQSQQDVDSIRNIVSVLQAISTLTNNSNDVTTTTNNDHNNHSNHSRSDSPDDIPNLG